MSQSTHPVEQIAKRSWSGVAQMIAPTGDILVEVAANLWEHTQDGRGTVGSHVQWGGHLEAPAHAEAPHLPSAENTYTLRLIGAGEGLVTTHGTVKMHLFHDVAPTEEVEVLGIGNTPF